MLTVDRLPSIVAEHAVNGDPSRKYRLRMIAISMKQDLCDVEFMLINPRGEEEALDPKAWRLEVTCCNKLIMTRYDKHIGRQRTKRCQRLEQIVQYQIVLEPNESTI